MTLAYKIEADSKTLKKHHTQFKGHIKIMLYIILKFIPYLLPFIVLERVTYAVGQNSHQQSYLAANT